MEFAIYLATGSVPPDLTVWRPYWMPWPIGKVIYFPVLDRPQPISEVFLFRDLPEGKGKIVVEIARAGRGASEYHALENQAFENQKMYTSGWVTPAPNSVWEFNATTHRFRQVLPQSSMATVTPVKLLIGAALGLGALVAYQTTRRR